MSFNDSGQPPPPHAVARLIESIFGGRRVAAAHRFTDGLTNFNYKVEFVSGAEPVVLRIYGRDSHALQKEVDLLGMLRGSIPVPEILHVQPGGFDGIGPFIITRYIEGITFRELKRTGDASAIAQAAYSIGETLAAVSRYKLAKRGMLGAGVVASGRFFDGPNAILEFIDSCLRSSTLRDWLDDRARDRIQVAVRGHDRELARLHDEAFLVHNDFGNRNVLVRSENGNWRVAAILDWEFAASGSPLFDVASFLRYERAANPVREPHFSLGYLQGGGTLPEDWRRLARVVDLTKLCETLTDHDTPEAILTEVAGLVQESIEALI